MLLLSSHRVPELGTSGMAGAPRYLCHKAVVLQMIAANHLLGVVQCTYLLRVVSHGNCNTFDDLKMWYPLGAESRKLMHHFMNIGCHLCPLPSFKDAASRCCVQKRWPNVSSLYFSMIFVSCSFVICWKQSDIVAPRSTPFQEGKHFTEVAKWQSVAF